MVANYIELQASINRSDQPRPMWLRRELVVGYYGGDGDGLTIMTMAGPIYTHDHTVTSFGVLLKGELPVNASPPAPPATPPIQPKAVTQYAQKKRY